MKKSHVRNFSAEAPREKISREIFSREASPLERDGAPHKIMLPEAERKVPFLFAFRSFFRTFDCVEGTALGKAERKVPFLFAFRSFFRTFAKNYEL